MLFFSSMHLSLHSEKLLNTCLSVSVFTGTDSYLLICWLAAQQGLLSWPVSLLLWVPVHQWSGRFPSWVEWCAAKAVVQLTLAALPWAFAGWTFFWEHLSCIESSQASYLRETSPSGASVVGEDRKPNLAMWKTFLFSVLCCSCTVPQCPALSSQA